MSEFFVPERSMLYVYIALNFECPNSNKDCLICPYDEFCILLKEYPKYMSDNYPELIKKFESILKDGE